MVAGASLRHVSLYRVRLSPAHRRQLQNQSRQIVAILSDLTLIDKTWKAKQVQLTAILCAFVVAIFHLLQMQKLH